MSSFNSRKGYVSVHREIMDHWLWQEKPFSKGQAWIDLILLANFRKMKIPYKNQLIDTERGTVYRSIKWLADRWGWSRDKTRKFLDLLQSDGMIAISATTHQTTITLINYDKYQISPTTNWTANQQQTDNSPTARRQPADTYNNTNNINNDNKQNIGDSSTRQEIPQSEDEIAEARKWFDRL